MNWLDWTLIAIVVASVLGGFREGFIRIGVGMVASVLGFIGASWFYGLAAGPLLPYVHSRMLANFVGFLIIFFGSLILGALLAGVLVRMFRIVGLSPVDRVLGGVLGGARSLFLLVVITMVLMAFAPRRLPAGVGDSKLAPYLMRAARVASAATPYELKNGVQQTIARLSEAIRHPARLISGEK
ncbi:MAG TPA: CvpA family protein [Bryobacteraceae bacterium]|nr:CvpA family protein [Bryobacteraceae bacterium]